MGLGGEYLPPPWRLAAPRTRKGHDMRQLLNTVPHHILCSAHTYTIVNCPSFVPSVSPSVRPSVRPSFLPSFLPSFFPSFLPSFLPSFCTSLSRTARNVHAQRETRVQTEVRSCLLSNVRVTCLLFPLPPPRLARRLLLSLPLRRSRGTLRARCGFGRSSSPAGQPDRRGAQGDREGTDETWSGGAFGRRFVGSAPFKCMQYDITFSTGYVNISDEREFWVWNSGLGRSGVVASKGRRP